MHKQNYRKLIIVVLLISLVMGATIFAVFLILPMRRTSELLTMLDSEDVDTIRDAMLIVQMKASITKENRAEKVDVFERMLSDKEGLRHLYGKSLGPGKQRIRQRMLDLLATTEDVRILNAILNATFPADLAPRGIDLLDCEEGVEIVRAAVHRYNESIGRERWRMQKDNTGRIRLFSVWRSGALKSSQTYLKFPACYGNS